MPTLTWVSAGEESFRVQVAIVMPEARLLETYDNVVNGSSYRLPRPITEAHAVIKVRVTSGCPQSEAQDLHAQGPTFFFDSRPTCRLAQGSVSQHGLTLRWPALGNAQRYRVRVFAPREDASMLSVVEEDVSSPAWVMRALPRDGQVVTVQPFCSDRPGLPVTFRLPRLQQVGPESAQDVSSN
jgi:hypothetical protein